MKLHLGMKVVGLRELKNRLSEYVREVRRGERVLVTDRGEVVAELTPPQSGAEAAAVPQRVEILARQGLVTLGRPNDARVYRALPAVLKPGRATSLLDSERGSQ